MDNLVEPGESYTSSSIITGLDGLGSVDWMTFLLANVESSQISDIIFTFEPGAIALVLDYQLVHPKGSREAERILANGQIQDPITHVPIGFTIKSGPTGFLDTLALKLRVAKGSAANLDQALVSLRIKRHRPSSTVPGWMPS